MNEYRHHVSGFFAHRDAAESTLSRLLAGGLPRDRVQIFTPNSVPPVSPQAEKKSDDVLRDVLVDATIGTAVGTGLGALGEVALVAANVSLFIASPLIAPLMMLGWGASLGALIGAAAGATKGKGHKHGWFSDLVHDAIMNGQVVLVAETRDEQETAAAREIIKASVGAFEDVAVAVRSTPGQDNLSARA
jgi:hypothetical protein